MDMVIDLQLLGLGGGIPVLGPADALDPFVQLIYGEDDDIGAHQEPGTVPGPDDLPESKTTWFETAKAHLEGLGGGGEWAMMIHLWMILMLRFFLI